MSDPVMCCGGVSVRSECPYHRDVPASETIDRAKMEADLAFAKVQTTPRRFEDAITPPSFVMVDVEDTQDGGAYGTIKTRDYGQGRIHVEVKVHHDASLVNLATIVQDGQSTALRIGGSVYRIHRERDIK